MATVKTILFCALVLAGVGWYRYAARYADAYVPLQAQALRPHPIMS